METTRRRFLGGLAVASALTGTAAHAVTAPAAGEDAALMKLGKEFDAAHKQFLDSGDLVHARQIDYQALAPTIPQELIAPCGSRFWREGFADYAIDPADPNYARIKDARGNLIEVVQSYRIDVKYGASFAPFSPHVLPDFTGADPEVLRIHGVAKGYEEAVDAALSMSGLGSALEDYRQLQAELRSTIQRLCAIRAKSLAGVGLKIRATAAYASFGGEERFTATGLLAQAVWEDMGEDS